MHENDISQSHLQGLNPIELEELEGFIARFEKAWQDGASPDIAAFIRSVCSSPSGDERVGRLQRIKSAHVRPVSPPRLIATFELIELLGQGAFDSVFRARDTKGGREVAIKMPRSGSILSTEEEERFLGLERQLEFPVSGACGESPSDN